MANFLVDHEYTLDITPSARPQLVPVSEYDVGRIFTFTLKHNGQEMTIPSSYGAVTVEGTIGSYAFSNCSREITENPMPSSMQKLFSTRRFTLS